MPADDQKQKGKDKTKEPRETSSGGGWDRVGQRKQDRATGHGWQGSARHDGRENNTRVEKGKKRKSPGWTWQLSSLWDSARRRQTHKHKHGHENTLTKCFNVTTSRLFHKGQGGAGWVGQWATAVRAQARSGLRARALLSQN